MHIMYVCTEKLVYVAVEQRDRWDYPGIWCLARYHLACSEGVFRPLNYMHLQLEQLCIQRTTGPRTLQTPSPDSILVPG